jgi:hypothetical protein
MHHMNWVDELAMFTMPYPLPAAAERAQLAGQGEGTARARSEGSSARYPSLSQRLSAAGASVIRFANPLPTTKTAQRLETSRAWLKYAAVWIHTRLEFVGRLIGVDERWTMFSPTVGTTRTVVRAVLSYADGTDVTVRSLVEPDDFTNFVRPFAQRRLQHDINLTQLEDVRSNWCRYLARTRPNSAFGSPLDSIGLYELRHALAPPGADAAQHWMEENARALPQAPSWRFDVTAGALTEVHVQTGTTEGAHGED